MKKGELGSILQQNCSSKQETNWTPRTGSYPRLAGPISKAVSVGRGYILPQIIKKVISELTLKLFISVELHGRTLCIHC